jgi:hypothetical protein
LDNRPDEAWKVGKYREILLDMRRELITASAREIAAAKYDYDPFICVTLAARSGPGSGQPGNSMLVTWCRRHPCIGEVKLILQPFLLMKGMDLVNALCKHKAI